MTSPVEILRADLKTVYPADLVDFLLASYQEIKEHYLLSRHEPSELNGGKLVEAFYRIIQFHTTGSFTPIGSSTNDMIGKLRAFEQLPASSTIESYRIHIPRTLATIYNIRNKRGVGHLGGDVNPNFVDSTLISACADWTLAELLRVHYSCSLSDAQRIVDSIVVRPNFLVYRVEGVSRVLNPNLRQQDQILVLLATEHPKPLPDKMIFDWIEAKSKSSFSSLLRRLHSQRLIEYTSDKRCIILPTGLKYVDENYQKFINHQ